MVDILNAFFQEHVGDHRHNNLEISERGGEPLVRGEGGPRSRARRVGARQGGVNGTISSTARAIISPTMRPHRSQERVSWHLRSVLDSATTDPVPCLDVCAFKPFRNDPSRAQLAVARKISKTRRLHDNDFFSLSSIEHFIRFSRNGKGCFELLSLDFEIIIVD